MRRKILSFFGSGYLRPAPGTWGSLAAVPAAWVIHLIGGGVFLSFCIGAAFVLGLKSTKMEIAEGDDHDPSWIVIDEVVGQWIALLPVAYSASINGVSVLALWPGIIAAFLLFRLFDILKPWPIKQLDRQVTGGVGIMLDDIVAGAFACLLLHAFRLGFAA